MSLQIPANWSASTDHDSVILEKNSTVRVGLVELDGLQKNVTWDTEGENWIAMKNYSKVETSLTDTGSGQKIDFGQGDNPRSFESACSATNIGVPKDRNDASRIMKMAPSRVVYHLEVSELSNKFVGVHVIYKACRKNIK